MKRLQIVRDSYGNPGVVLCMGETRVTVLQLAGSDFGHMEGAAEADVEARGAVPDEQKPWAKQQYARWEATR